MLGTFVHIQPSTLLTRFLQTPAPLRLETSLDKDSGRGPRSRESICCPSHTSPGEVLCNSADDSRFVVAASVETQDRAGLAIYTKRVKSREFEVPLAGKVDGVVLLPGQTVEVLRRVAHWVQVHVLLPVSSSSEGEVKAEVEVEGWTELFTHITAADSSKDKSRGSTLGYVVNLVPVKELEYSRHGQARPLVTSCGHAMHSHCWDTYMASTLSRHINSRHYGGYTTTDADIGEVCWQQLPDYVIFYFSPTVSPCVMIRCCVPCASPSEIAFCLSTQVTIKSNRLLGL